MLPKSLRINSINHADTYFHKINLDVIDSLKSQRSRNFFRFKKFHLLEQII